jgi:hypothetical protein
MAWRMRRSNSSNFSGRLSSALGQPEAVLDQRGLARTVAVVHAAELADHLVALVQEHQRVLGQVVGQRGRRVARRGARQVAGVVLDALAVAHLAEHLQVEAGALLQALRLHQLALVHELLQPPGQLQLDGLHRGQHLLARRHVVAGGVDGEARDLLLHAAGERVEQLQASISSSNSSMRTASSLCSAGNTSMVSPRTRKLAAREVLSLRWYCMRTSWAITSRWPILSPTRSVITIWW